MGARISFFSTPKINGRMLTVASLLRDSDGRADTRVEQSRARLAEALNAIAQNADSFDDNCQFNIANVGNGFADAITEPGGKVNAIDLPRLNALVFRFVTEYDISVVGELSLELRLFLDGVLTDSEADSYKDQINYALHRMPVAILKEILNSGDFVTLRNVQTISQSTTDRVAIWKKELESAEKRVNDLQNVLKNQKDSFNFVGLSKGFSDLEDTIKEELDTLQGRLFVFGGLILIPIILEFLSINLGWVKASSENIVSIVGSAVASIAATLLLLYFFRITLRSADACRAQLIQVRLRLTLCRFIQGYAESSKDIKGQNEDAFSKFENLIFSGIVSTDEKLPSTFDGIEQLSGLLKAIRGDGKG